MPEAISQARSQVPFRLVQASDLHLERPLGPVASVPEHLQELFLEAPYLAAEQVFETVLAEGADALVLCGDVADPLLAGPRGIQFLLEQFRRLADHQKPVYWACGGVDLNHDWPTGAELPDNVHRFPVGRVGSLEWTDAEGKVIAHIQGISQGVDSASGQAHFSWEVHGGLTIAVAYAADALSAAGGDRIDYVALGGLHARRMADHSPSGGRSGGSVDQCGKMVHFSGAPQGRSVDESGPHGCTVVSIDDAGEVKTRFVATDAARWLTETIEITSGTDEQWLLHQMKQRKIRLREKETGPCLLVTWKITGKGPLINRIRPGGHADSLLQQLHGQEQDTDIWSIAIECDVAPDVHDGWRDQETILGDLLRQVQELEQDAKIPLNLEEFLPASCQAHGAKGEGAVAVAGEQADSIFSDPALAELAAISKPSARAHLLHDATRLGIDMILVEDAG
jgi:DNA repair exonuclease SbcCD nuclease subunit